LETAVGVLANVYGPETSFRDRSLETAPAESTVSRRPKGPKFRIGTRARRRDAFRLHNVSTTEVDFRGRQRTPVDTETAEKSLSTKHLIPEVARHQEVSETVLLRFRLPPPPFDSPAAS
jgi:hypothetical protein